MTNSGNLKFKGLAMLVGVFVLGTVTGISLDGLYRGRRAAAAPPLSLKENGEYFETLRHELALNPEQTTAVRGILDDTRNEYKTVCSEVRPRYNVLRDRARTRMRALLNPDQQKRFDVIVTQESCNCPELQKQ
jgi:hypothetical protein